MKAYRFRLEPVLKLRKLKEETCRIELGQLLAELARIEDQLKHDKAEVEKIYLIQQGALEASVKAHQLQAFPMMLAAKAKNIQLLERDRIQQEALVEEKRRELAGLRGELKVIETMKDKDYQEYRRALGKEQDQKVEEQTRNWLNHRNEEAKE